ncbi:MAG: TauD/TfdA family dioxygenase [Pseudomonadota bacterium]
MTDTALRVAPIAGALGAEVFGADLAGEVSDLLFEELHQTFLDHLVIFLPGQKISPEKLVAFSRRFGEIAPVRFTGPFDMPAVEGFPEIYQITKEPETTGTNIGGFWHADVTYRERPNLASIGYLVEAPEYGGDTMYSNLYLAYESLSEGMRDLLDGLTAVHSSTMPHAHGVRSAAVSREHAPKAEDGQLQIVSTEVEIIETEHPVVRRHPDTGRKSLYVNRGFTSRFSGMSEEESLPLLQYLWAHTERPEFTCRYRLAQDTVVVWDNRCVLHYALNDYYGQRRVLQRVSVDEPSRPSA